MAAATHRVRKQSWRVAVRSAPEAFAARARLRAELENALLPEFERAFDAAAPGEAIVRIPRLALRLRVAGIGELASALREALARELKLPPAAPPRPPAVQWHELLLAYLESGVLAWHEAHRDAADATTQLRAALAVALERVMRAAPSAATPLARRVEFHFRLLQLLARERWPEAARALAATANAPVDAPAVTAEAAIAALRSVPGSAPARVHRLAAVVLAGAGDSQIPVAGLREALEACFDLDARSAIRAPGAGAEGQALVERLATLPAPAATFFALRAGIAPFTAPDSIARESVQPTPRKDELRTVPEPRAAGDFALAANCAGLVLLHPFLPRLLEGCDLYRAPALRSLPRAAALLHWLATGREQAHEFELGFVKLLLGQRPDAPLLVEEGLLCAAERDEGETLLRAVITHWKALGNTTTEGLRVAFLQRRGALREEEDGWRLRLEPESFDVLLARLPWGLATVRLPWMTRPLYTDWPTS